MRTAAIQQGSSQAEGDTPGCGWCQVITALVAAIASLLVAGSACAARSDGGARLAGVGVVRDATVSGVLSPTPAGIAGTVRLAGSGVPAGRLRVQLAASGRGHATGALNGQRVELAFHAI
jgi:hypothetical protein